MRQQPSGRTRQLVYIGAVAAVFSVISYSYKYMAEPDEAQQLSQLCSSDNIQLVDSGQCDQLLADDMAARFASTE